MRPTLTSNARFQLGFCVQSRDTRSMWWAGTRACSHSFCLMSCFDQPAAAKSSARMGDRNISGRSVPPHSAPTVNRKCQLCSFCMESVM